MNILLIIHHHLDPNSGAPGVTLKLGQYYEQLGHNVFYYSFDDLPKYLPTLAQMIAFPEFVAAHLANLIKSQSIDVIDASTGDTWFWSRFLKKTLSNSPLLAVQSHGLEQIVHQEFLKEAQLNSLPISWKYPLYHGGMRLWEVAESLRQADIAFMLNRRDADYTVEELKVAPERVHILANGIPDNFLNLSFELNTSQDTASQDTTSQDLTIALVGTYISRKGIHYSLPALKTILARYPQVKVSFLGTCCPEEQVYADFESAFHHRIRVVSSYPHHYLPFLLQGHEILLFPSLSEGFGLAVLEGMACGLAPISTDIPGPTEMVVHEENGLLIPVRDSQAIEQALERLILNRSYLNQLRQKAYTTAQSYSWLQITQKRLAIYEEVLSKKAPTPSSKRLCGNPA